MKTDGVRQAVPMADASLAGNIGGIQRRLQKLRAELDKLEQKAGA